MNRRLFIVTAAAGAAELARAQHRGEAAANLPDAIRNLKPMLDGVQPITDAERSGRIEKALRLMHQNNIDAILCQGGATFYYFTGVRGGDSTWVLLAKGEAASFEADGFLQFLKAAHPSRVGIEERAPFSILEGLRKKLPAAEFVSADPVTVGCRVIKSPAEIALLQRANDITIACYKAAFQTLREGMTQGELSANIAAAYRALGVQGNAMAIFGKFTAFPHGSIQPQQLREGDMVLVDDGCSVEGYQSDITRTTVFGKPTKRQTEIWNLERKAQDAALAAANPGATCESVDAAARKVITDAGFGPGYKVPGLPHRTGHGIGLEGHEWTYLVKGNRTQLQPGMCFSDEPTIAIYGEFGVRLEDCMYITESGARMFTKQSPAIDQPFG
jgi:Xaa-Pro dipeptidase